MATRVAEQEEYFLALLGIHAKLVDGGETTQLVASPYKQVIKLR